MSLVNLRTASSVSASTNLSRKRKNLSVPKNLFASTGSTVLPVKPADFTRASYSSAVMFDGSIFVPFPLKRSNVLSAPRTMSDAPSASAATFTAPAACLKPGAIGTDSATAPSRTPDIRLYAVDPSSKIIPAVPLPNDHA